MTVGLSPFPADAEISPSASGCPPQSRSSASPPARRTKSQTHSPAFRTSSARSESALTLGMRMNSESSSSQAWSTAREFTDAAAAAATPATASAVLTAALCRDVLQRLGFCERPQLLQALVLDLPNPLACDVERPPDLVQRARMLAVEPVAELEHTALPGR